MLHVSTISIFCMTLKCNGTPQCSYNIDALSAIHYDVSRVYLEGRIRLLEIAKQGIRSGVCWSRNIPRFFDVRCLLSEFRSRWIRAKRDVTSRIYFGEINACVCAKMRMYTPAHTRDRGGWFAERVTHLSEIFYSLHWFRIAFIYRILKLELLLLPSSHSARRHRMSRGKHKIGKTNHARHSTSNGWHPNSLRVGILWYLSIRQSTCGVYAKTIVNFKRV